METLTIIKPTKGLLSIDLKELFRYRELLWTFADRDIKVRYKQTLIGGVWAILQPFLTMVVFSFFFGKIAKIPSDNVPYPIFSYAGLLLWTFFTNSLSSASNSMINNAGIITKVYFPRLIIPLSSTLVSVLDYGIALIIMVGMMIYYRITPSPAIILLPIVFLITWLLANGIGLWLAAINVKYRDVRYAVPFFIQLLVFITPVIYPLSVAGNYQLLVSLNPMTGLLEAHRAMFLGQQVNFGMLVISTVLTLIILLSGLAYFRSVERFFADII